MITQDDWKIRTYLQKDVFELYYLPDDFREGNDLSTKYPDKLADLKKELLQACEGEFSNGLFSPKTDLIKLK